MKTFWWYSIFLINCVLGSAKFIEPGVDRAEEEEHDHLGSFEGPEPGWHHHHIDLLHPVRTDPVKDGLWMLKTKMEQLKMFELALKEKLEADRIHREHKLHADLERLLHPKEHPSASPAASAAHSYERPPRQHASHYPMGGYQHESNHPIAPPQPPPPPPPAKPYDPYYGY